MAEQKKKKLKKKADKKNMTKIIPITDKETEEENIEEEDDAGGIYMEKSDVLIIYNALMKYRPTQKEMQRFDLLVESFEEMLVIDYGVKLPGFEFMDEKDD